MSRGSRDEILDSLRGSPLLAAAEKPVSEPSEACRSENISLTDAFCAEVAEQTGIVYRHDPAEDIGHALAGICREHGIRRLISGCCKRLAAAGLPGAAEKAGLEIVTQFDLSGRADFTDAVFDRADAGLTGADYGVAESGTLVLTSAREHARLISLAPEVHIAVLAEDRIVAAYEQATEKIFEAEKAPAHIVFVTGPSMTADIRGMPFKGMHGPKKLIVILTRKEPPG